MAQPFHHIRHFCLLLVLLSTVSATAQAQWIRVASMIHTRQRCSAHWGAASAPILTETFTGSDGDSLAIGHVGELAGAWSLTNVDGACEVRSNRLRGSNSTFSVWRSAAVPTSADYSVTAVIRSLSAPGGLWGPIGRCVHRGDYFYAAWYSGYQTGWVLYKRINGTLTQLGSTVTATLTNGTDYTLTLDLIGTTIRLLVDGVVQITVTDSDIIEAGTAGLAIEEGAPGNTTGKHLDNIKAEQKVVVPAFLPNVAFVADGDSIFTDYSRLGTRTISMILSGASRWNTSRYWGYAVGAQTVVNALSDAPTQIDPLVALMSGYTKALCVVMLGINDVIGSDSVATIDANIRAYHSARRSVGFRTVGLTLLKASSVGGANETRRQAINSGLVADPSFCDYFVDAAAFAQFSNTADTTYYVDGVHLTVAGAGVLADAIVAAVG